MSNKPVKSIKKLQEQIVELTEALQRERADAQNLRRRHEEQLSGIKSLVQANVIREFLPVIDSCERLLHHISTNSKEAPWKQGVEQIYKQLEKTLADMDVERIKTVGEVFDPKLHEAVHMEDGDGSIEVVCEELQSGYKIGDEVIRHAMVRVKKVNKEKENDE